MDNPCKKSEPERPLEGKHCHCMDSPKEKGKKDRNCSRITPLGKCNKSQRQLLCARLRLVRETSKILENILDIASTITKIMCSCGIHECKANLATDVVIYTFLHFDETVECPGGKIKKTIRKEDFLCDLRRDCGMTKNEAKLSYSIVKCAFKAFYYKQVVNRYDDCYFDECAWLEAARKTIKAFQAQDGVTADKVTDVGKKINSTYIGYLKRRKAKRDKEMKKLNYNALCGDSIQPCSDLRHNLGDDPCAELLGDPADFGDRNKLYGSGGIGRTDGTFGTVGKCVTSRTDGQLNVDDQNAFDGQSRTYGPNRTGDPDGNVGNRGAVGPGGNIGDRGAVGPGGNIGDRGAVGPGGNIGDRGAVGSGGNVGDRGAVGPGGNLGSKDGSNKFETALNAVTAPDGYIVPGAFYDRQGTFFPGTAGVIDDDLKFHAGATYDQSKIKVGEQKGVVGPDGTFIVGASYSPDGVFIPPGGISQPRPVLDPPKTEKKVIQQVPGTVAPDGTFVPGAFIDNNNKFNPGSAGAMGTDGKFKPNIVSEQAGVVGPDGKFVPGAMYTPTGQYIPPPPGAIAPDGTFVPGATIDRDGKFNAGSAGVIGPDGKFYAGATYDDSNKLIKAPPGAVAPDGKFVIGGSYDSNGVFIQPPPGVIGPSGKFVAGASYGPNGEYIPPPEGVFAPDGTYVTGGFYNADGSFNPGSGGVIGPDGKYHAGATYDSSSNFVPAGKFGVVGPDGKFSAGAAFTTDGKFVSASPGAVGPDGKFIAGAYYDADGNFIIPKLIKPADYFGPNLRGPDGKILSCEEQLQMCIQKVRDLEAEKTELLEKADKFNIGIGTDDRRYGYYDADGNFITTDGDNLDKNVMTDLMTTENDANKFIGPDISLYLKLWNSGRNCDISFNGFNLVPEFLENVNNLKITQNDDRQTNFKCFKLQ